ncbi:Coenzyme F420 hydrogenase/dehydrogenase, beta subunit C-terminal domain [Sphingomonas sp. FW199]|uniref:Coenzyme F420 hydrogenase/dehydrogenase, beta subunit C-terminal domain n=1 Tax=Sphingomonas sp. FW199 TaxID=3400217 RepID=UPI003CEEF597
MNQRSPTLDRVLAGNLCSGCGLCAGVAGDAVQMAEVAPGYARPVQTAPVDDATERAIAIACPGSTVAAWASPAPNRHPYWGPYFRNLTGQATDPDTRFAGASGGAVSALAIHALETGMVERVLHVEADPDQPMGNRMRWSLTREEVIGGAGSRYAASSPLAFIDAALNEGRRFAVIGKPCDISALRQLSQVDARVNQQVPVMLSFYCGGMPSSAGADRIVRAMGLEPDRVVRFRYRGNGWPGLTVAETDDGREGSMSYAESWGGHLSKEVQFRCKICPDAVGGVADVACADAWYGGESGYPQFEERDGRSLIQSRTAAGDALLASAEQAGAIIAEPLDIGEVELMQPAQANRKRMIVARTAACRVVGRPVPDMHGTDVSQAARRGKVKDHSTNFLGMVRRLVQR